MTATFAIVALALYLLFGEPLLGRRAHRRLLAALDAGEAGTRLRFYRQWTWQGWALALVTLAVTLGLAGWSPARLGLRLPRLPDGTGTMLGGFAAGVALAVAGGLVVGTLLGRRRRQRPRQATPPVAGGAQVLRMLPRTRGERLGFAALAVTAGITEEVVWRGFGLGLLAALLPQAPVAVPILLAALAFGWAHFYQGWTGMLATALIGALLALLYHATGSLLPPMLLHVLIDLRALLVRVPADPAPSPGAAP